MKKMFIVFVAVSVFSTLISCSANRPRNTTYIAGHSVGGETFGIYICRLDGSGFEQITADPSRELSHARVSPDKQTLTFSRFNKKALFEDLAEEINGDTGSEIMLTNLDGSDLKSFTPPDDETVNVNSYWTPKGDTLIYTSNSNTDKNKLAINEFDLQTNKITKISPEILPWISDPHQVGNKVVFAATRDPEMDFRSIWLWNRSTNEMRELTRPSFPAEMIKIEKPLPGDSNPKLSPDGKLVAFTRHQGDGTFRIIIYDLSEDIERYLSYGDMVDLMPEWSSDGKLLVFWHVNLLKPSETGLYTIQPDGKARRQIPLPRGYHFKMPAFFPGEGSGPDARVIFSGKKVPELR